MGKMKVKLKGVDRLLRDLKRSLTKIPIIAANEYKKEIVKNLQPSRKTGALSKSWKVKKSLTKANVSSDLPYAAIQNYGGRIRITDKMRNKMWALYKEFRLPVYKAIATTKNSHVVIPAKGYLNVDRKKIMRKVDITLNKITTRI